MSMENVCESPQACATFGEIQWHVGVVSNVPVFMVSLFFIFSLCRFTISDDVVTWGFGVLASDKLWTDWSARSLSCLGTGWAGWHRICKATRSLSRIQFSRNVLDSWISFWGRNNKKERKELHLWKGRSLSLLVILSSLFRCNNLIDSKLL